MNIFKKFFSKKDNSKASVSPQAQKAWKALELDSAKMFNELIDEGYDFNTQNADGDHIGHCAARRNNTKVCGILLKGGTNIDVNVLNKKGNSMMHYLIDRSEATLVQMAINNNANLMQRNRNGNTLAHFAASSGNYNVLRMLLERSPQLLFEVNNSGETAAHSAAASGATECLNTWIQCGGRLDIAADSGESLLHYAVKHNCIRSAKFLLESGHIRNAIDNYFNSPAHFAIANKNKDMFDLLNDGSLKMSLRNDLGESIEELLSASNFFEVPNTAEAYA